jgi:hypothetical protein
MKNAMNKLTPIAAALALSLSGISVAQADDFKLSDKLSVTGFIDMSWSYTDVDGQGSDQSAGLDQFEIDFLYGFNDKLTAQVDLEYQDNGDGEEVDVEQAFISYALSKDFSIKAGRFLSYSGWETEEPTGLFQYSGTGYAKYFYGGYQQGLSAFYGGDKVAVAASVVNDLGDLEGEARDSEDPGFEFMLALMPTESVTLKGFYMTDKLAGTDEDIEMMNFWASFATGGLTLAAEYNMSENTAFVDSDATGYLLMANYGFENDWALTLRYHAWEVEDAAGTVVEDMSGITLAPSYAVNDNLLMVFEYRMDSDDISDVDSDSIAIEALVTF